VLLGLVVNGVVRRVHEVLCLIRVSWLGVRFDETVFA